MTTRGSPRYGSLINTNNINDFSSKLQGSVYVNNTSYSGCDIQIILNGYDFGRAGQEEYDKLFQQLTEMQTELDSAKSQISSISNKLGTTKQGTDQETRLNRKYDKLEGDQRTLQLSIIMVQDQLKEAADKLKQPKNKVLAECQTLSLSVFRDKQAVKSCGSVYPKGFTRGSRTIAGSLIFTVFNQHVLYEFLEAHPSDFDAMAYSSSVMDQLPPVDITISFANEYGHVSRMAIYGAEFVNEGQTMGIEDLLTENVVNYVARDYDPMRIVADREIDKGSNMLRQEMGKKASDLILEEDYMRFKGQNSPFELFKRRRSPFI